MMPTCVGILASLKNRKMPLATPLDLALLGPFDNDQGKGFDAPYGLKKG